MERGRWARLESGATFLLWMKPRVSPSQAPRSRCSSVGSLLDAQAIIDPLAPSNSKLAAAVLAVCHQPTVG